jgi:hypothetical protein
MPSFHYLPDRSPLVSMHLRHSPYFLLLFTTYILVDQPDSLLE